MQSDWLHFLTQQGAILENNRILHFGNPDQALDAAFNSNILCDLSHNGLIACAGADTVSFLQGQLTNDVTQVQPERSQLSAYCSPKGRMLTTLRLFWRAGIYYISLPHEQFDAIRKRLRMFVLRADVVLNDVSDSLIGVGLSGPNVARLLQDKLTTVPAQIDDTVTAEGVTIIRVPGIQPRFEIYGDVATLKGLWTALAPHTTLTGEEAWRLLTILAGVPTVYSATTDAFVPQMANLDLLNGINFRKGCYTGQEIVARTHYLGKLKRRMYQGRVNSPTTPIPGDEVFGAQEETETQSIGRIVDACRHPEGGFAVLAVVVIEQAENNPVKLANGNTLDFVPLPYSFEPAIG
jgi:folate-binding protein YgfZ